jgi:hypothetical protein
MMNRWILFGTVLVFVVTAYAGEQVWYRDPQNVFWRLKEGQTFVAELDLPPGASRPVRIETATTLWVGFKAKISFEQFKEFSQKNQKPIKLQQDDDTAIAGASSVATKFTPRAGVISLTATNRSDVAIVIAVYTEKVAD